MTLDLDPERRLALAYVPAARRAAIETLWRLDATLGSVLATGSDPMISRIRLAWWRESLEKLDREKPPAEPMLEAVARDLLHAGVTGAELAQIEEGWAALLTPEAPTSEELDLYAKARGGRLFALSARLLSGGTETMGPAGESWALIDLARHTSREDEARAALAASGQRPSPKRFPKALRPLGMLAVLAREDAARGLPMTPQGSPARMLRMLRHRLTGR
jgi:phytoene synthase